MNWRTWTAAALLALGLLACSDESDPAAAALACAAGTTSCGGGCADTQTDPRHCGGCDAACADGEVCSDGACMLSCPAEQAACDGGCFTLATDEQHCGACGEACAAGEICVDGACALSCGPGEIECDGTCTAPERDRTNCGGCGIGCAADERCIDSACTRECGPGRADCGGTCSVLGMDRNNCGACGVTCAGDESCVDGACTKQCPPGVPDVCDGTCTSTARDPSNCGGCGITCGSGEVCDGGVCAGACGAASVECSGSCTSLEHDPANCGACGTTCEGAADAMPICTSGGCARVCGPGVADCDADLANTTSNGCETEILTNPEHCGACGNACTEVARGATACVAGSCAIVGCDLDFADCDGRLETGCETDVRTARAHCGACNVACGSGEYCDAGACTPYAPADSCAAPHVLTTGAATIHWSASNLDYLGAAPSCSTTPGAGVDLTFQWTAPITGAARLAVQRPTGQRFHLVVSDAPCGTLSPELACISSSAGSEEAVIFPIAAGTTYTAYLSPTSSAQTLPQPLNVALELVTDCAVAPSLVSTAPANGQSVSAVGAVAEATFDRPVDISTGTITLTGSLGGARTITLPSESVSLSADERTLTITVDGFLPTELVTVDWSGLVDTYCDAPLPVPAWTFTIGAAPCGPGLGGMVGANITTSPLGLLGTLAEGYVAADSAPDGWVYVGGTSDLYRKPKLGGPPQDVAGMAGLGTAHLGYTMVIDGPNIYTVESRSSGVDGQLFRISTDGGATWFVEDAATFPVSPNDDFRGAAAYGGSIYLITDEPTGGAEVWSVNVSGSLPALAKQEMGVATADYHSCQGLALDAASYYTICSSVAAPGSYGVLRVDRVSGAITELTNAFPGGGSNMPIHVADRDGDGNAELIYWKADREEGYAICMAGGVPWAMTHYNFGTASSGNLGLGFDPVANVLWAWDDDTAEFVRIE